MSRRLFTKSIASGAGLAGLASVRVPGVAAAASAETDNFYSCAFWYQDRPYTEFPALPAVAQRMVGRTP